MTNAQELTRRLVARDGPRSEASGDVGEAANLACERVYRELSRWLGPSGSDALFSRSLAHGRDEHPVLAEIRIHTQSDSGLEGVAESIALHGAVPVAAALEALLVAVLELLARLIGDDMTTRLMEQAMPTHAHDHRETRPKNPISEGARPRDDQ